MRGLSAVRCVMLKLLFFLLLLTRWTTTAKTSDVQQQAKMTTCELIRYFGFTCETANATTDDGYIIEVDRVGQTPQDNDTSANRTKRKSIILVPGILADSCSWFINYPSQSAGFLLAQRGYDVWAMNTRDILYRSQHQSLSQSDDRYWQWSFEEIGRYDIAAVVDLVLSVTGSSKVTLLVYSQGMTASVVLLSTRPEYNEKIDLLVAYGPVVNLTNIGFPIRELMAVSDPLFLLLDPLKDSGYFNLPEASRQLTKLVCGVLQGQPCSLLLSITLLSSPEQMNKTRLPVVLAHYPIGTSYQNLRHFVQINRAKNFLMYDYGASKNKKRYGQEKPPAYDVGRIAVKTALFSSQGDNMADPKDVSLLVERLGTNLLFNNVVPQKNFRHLDFPFGYQATKFLHELMLDTIENDDGTST